MKIGTLLLNLLILSIIGALAGCQKEDFNEPNQKVSICPEIAMNNYEEAGLMINEYLKNHPTYGQSKMSDQLISYLEKCDCIDTIKISSTIIYTYPSIREYSIRFIIGRDTINKEMDIYLYNDSKIEFHKFHE
jgi:hypothetical protein